MAGATTPAFAWKWQCPSLLPGRSESRHGRPGHASSVPVARCSSVRSAIALVVLGAVLLAGCSEDAPPRTAAHTTTAAVRVSPPLSTTTPRFHGHDPAPTRLVAGPVLVRLTGTPAPTKTDGSPQVRYVLIFRLDRGYKAIRNGQSYGAFLIAGGGLDPFPFGRRGSHCFGAVVEGKGSDDPETARRLDKVRRGERVRVEIKPLTLKAGKNKQIDHPFVRRPRMRVSALVSDIVSHTLSRRSDFTNPSARSAIRRLGC